MTTFKINKWSEESHSVLLLCVDRSVFYNMDEIQRDELRFMMFQREAIWWFILGLFGEASNFTPSFNEQRSWEFEVRKKSKKGELSWASNLWS